MLDFFRSMVSKVASGSSLRARLARAAVWMLVGSGLNQGFSMLASIGAARILGKTGFGEFYAVRGTTMTLAVLAGGGLGIALIRQVAALRTQDPQHAGRLIRVVMTLAWSMTAVAAVACALLARPIASHIMQSEKLALPLAMSSLAIIFSTVAGAQLGVIAGCEAFRPVAILLALEGFYGGVLMVTGAWLGGVTGAVLGYVVGTFISYLLRRRQIFIECRKADIPIVPASVAGLREEMPFIVSAVLPSMLLVLGMQPAEWAARMLLVRGAGGMAALGLFTAAYSWAQMVQFIPSQITSPALTLLSSLVGSGDWPAFRRLLAESSAAVFGTAVAIAIPLALLSKFVLGLYGPAFRDGAAAFSVIVLAYAVSSVWMMLRATFQAAGRMWLQFWLTLAWGVALLLLFVLQKERSALTLSISYGIAFLSIVVAQLLAAWFLFRARPQAVQEGL